MVAASIRRLGFNISDVKFILNTHAHFDHAGGIAELQRLSHATVAASPWSARVLRAGRSDRSDPAFSLLQKYPPVHSVKAIHDGEVIRVGLLP